ncbi:hypothetical protein [Xylophilus sp.]|uniref:hypothetical protein n=1 Tax=Xylophilus sp. TaxID=2653893 RepID=UPI0013BE3B22|nr:hypothetical protein [Xylophilus sp.]KAF1045640.1 MAG: hypothetical protein GAK38_02932 [Xylophilus sp.]
MRNALHTSSTKAKPPFSVSQYAGTLVAGVDVLAMAVEDDVTLPRDVAFHVRLARDELALAHNAMLHDAANDSSRGAVAHYMKLAVEASADQVAGSVA